MKASHFYIVKMFVFVMLILFLSAKVIKSQTNYLQVGTTVTPFTNYSGNLLIGYSATINTPPFAKLHLFSNSGFPTQPLFQTEVRNGMYGWMASIQHCIYVGNQNYGIYQTSVDNSGVKNYFQDPVKIWKVEIGKESDNTAKILTLTGVNYLDFVMDPGGPSFDPSTPLTINYSGITVRSNLVTDNFQLLSTPGSGKVLMSDNSGNGTWTDPISFLENYWKINHYDELYTLKNVGIGTINPNDIFQVNDGADKLVIGSADGATFNYGTSYLGFNAFRSLGNWTIESNFRDNGGSVLYGDIFGNMNFITVPTEEPRSHNQSIRDDEMLSMTRMTISKDGDVGIGTRNPVVSLDINKDGATIIRAFSLGSYPSSIWAMNYNGGYGLSTDETGIGHIDENAWANPPHHIITFQHSGKVGIGQVDDLDSYSDNSFLFVQGGITTEEVTVKLKEDWSDFVFNKDYKIRSISELDQYIQTNKHLPGIPTNTDVEKKGIELGKMNALLLQKIEELTFYIIEQQKEINALQDAQSKKK